MATVVLVDDHPIVRGGLRGLLDSEPVMRVIGEAADAQTALSLIEQKQPDLAIVDLMLPDLNGLEVTRRIRQTSPTTQVVILSMHSDEQHVIKALQAGAMAYVLKGTDTEALLFALREVLAGRHYLSPPLSERAIEAYQAQAGSPAHALDRYELLTTREREVLELLARGMSYAVIAERLTISARTAETHRTNLMRKLGLQTQAELTRYALQRGLISLE